MERMGGSFARHYVITLVVFLILDAIWLGLIARRLYQAQIGFIMARRPKWAAAGAFYLLFVVGLVVFCVSPGVREGSLGQAAWRAALFGLVTYATYDLTNLATLEGWPILVTAIDLAWGTTLATATTLLSVWFMRVLQMR
jgi:uncharacterized membrane protein